MPSLSSRSGARFVKMLFMGDSGTGKTGALSSLVKAGYSLLILDFDNGIDILANYLDPKERERVFFETLTDAMKSIDGQVLPAGMPRAFSKGMNILTTGTLTQEDASGERVGDPIKLGAPGKLGPEWIVVIDSLTHCARAAYNWQLVANSALKDRRMVYFHAQNLVRGMLALLYDASFTTNVIVNCHVDYQEDVEARGFDEKGEPVITLKGWPRSIGSALNPEIGSYFNTVVRAKVSGTGPSARRTIKTVPEGLTDLKNSMPSKLKAELPLGTGLAEIFKVLTGKDS